MSKPAQILEILVDLKAEQNRLEEEALAKIEALLVPEDTFADDEAKSFESLADLLDEKLPGGWRDDSVVTEAYRGLIKSDAARYAAKHGAPSATRVRITGCNHIAGQAGHVGEVGVLQSRNVVGGDHDLIITLSKGSVWADSHDYEVIA